MNCKNSLPSHIQYSFCKEYQFQALPSSVSASLRVLLNELRTRQVLAPRADSDILGRSAVLPREVGKDYPAEVVSSAEHHVSSTTVAHTL